MWINTGKTAGERSIEIKHLLASPKSQKGALRAERGELARSKNADHAADTVRPSPSRPRPWLCTKRSLVGAQGGTPMPAIFCFEHGWLRRWPNSRTADMAARRRNVG
jgi:hypothetical protein